METLEGLQVKSESQLAEARQTEVTASHHFQLLQQSWEDEFRILKLPNILWVEVLTLLVSWRRQGAFARSSCSERATTVPVAFATLATLAMYAPQALLVVYNTPAVVFPWFGYSFLGFLCLGIRSLRLLFARSYCDLRLAVVGRVHPFPFIFLILHVELAHYDEYHELMRPSLRGRPRVMCSVLTAIRDGLSLASASALLHLFFEVILTLFSSSAVLSSGCF